MSSAKVAGALACILISGCATKQADDVRRGVAGAATLPLRDVGLIRPDIPAPLQGLNYPYKTDRLYTGCPQVQYEIGRLDASLGVESYQPGEARSLSQRGADAAANATVGAAEDTAADLIPFRGWVRRASGATKAERDYARAIEMGQTRRAFLRGYGAALGCLNVVPPPPPESETDEARAPRDAPPQRSPR